MKITLSEQHDMWFLIGTTIHLSFEHPGPVEVDMDALRPDQKQQVIWSLQKGVIGSDQPLEEAVAKSLVARSYSNPPEIKTEQVVESSTTLPALNAQQAERRTALKAALSQNFNSFKKDMKTYTIYDLRMLKDIETEGKARKSTLDLLETAITKHQNEVSKSVAREDNTAKPVNPKALLGGGHRVDWGNITDIVEEEFEDVEIDVGVTDEGALENA